jgi:predicted DNA-binding protein (UPF0251 family)
MEKRTKIKIAAGAAAAVAVAGGGVAVGATKVWSPTEESQAVIADAAERLGVDPRDLSEALKQALEDRVDAAVEARRLTRAQGDELKARIAAGDVPFGSDGLGRDEFFHVGHFADLDAAATYLGLSQDELRSRLFDGKTLAEIAKAQGKTVGGLVKALVKEAEQRIDAAVADGRLTHAQGDELKSGLEKRVTDLVNGVFAAGERFRHGFVPGEGFRFHGDFSSVPGPPA